MKNLLATIAAVVGMSVFVQAETLPADSRPKIETVSYGAGSDFSQITQSEYPLATFKGQPVFFYWFYPYNGGSAFLGDELLFNDYSLQVDSVNNDENTAYFRRGAVHKAIDFDNPGAIDELKALVAVPEGWKTEELKFSYYEYSPYLLLYMFVESRYKFVLPDNPAKAKKILNYLSSKRTTDGCPVKTMYGYVERCADGLKSDIENDLKVNLDTVEVYEALSPYCMAGDIVTLLFHTLRFEIDYCDDIQTYITLDLGSGKHYGFDEIFKPGSKDKIAGLYYDFLAGYMLDNGYYLPAGLASCTSVKMLSRKFREYVTAELIGRDATSTMYETAALGKDGVLFTPPDISMGNGSVPLPVVMIPYSQLKKYLRPEIAGITAEFE